MCEVDAKVVEWVADIPISEDFSSFKNRSISSFDENFCHSSSQTTQSNKCHLC